MKFLSSLCALLLLAAVTARAQTLTALPTATTHQVTIGIVNNCPTGVACTFNLYRCTGAASACSTASSVWLLLNSAPLAATSASYVDSAVSTGVTYNYAAYALATVGGTAETAGPSDEVAATVPLGPAAPTLQVSGAQ